MPGRVSKRPGEVISSLSGPPDVTAEPGRGQLVDHLTYMNLTDAAQSKTPSADRRDRRGFCARYTEREDTEP
jgi:hypothetical protein